MYKLPENYAGGTPWLPQGTIDYVYVLWTYIGESRMLKVDWQIYLEGYKYERKLEDLHPHDLNRLARAWLAEMGYHLLRTID
jgi:hypothetical protein